MNGEDAKKALRRAAHIYAGSRVASRKDNAEAIYVAARNMVLAELCELAYERGAQGHLADLVRDLERRAVRT